MGGDPGIDRGVVGYSYPASEQLAEWLNDPDSGGVWNSDVLVRGRTVRDGYQ